MRHAVTLRSIELPEGDELPREFLIFARGSNPSSKGEALFDDAAAKSVMANFRRQGVDQMIDNEHDSLDPNARAMRGDAANALGWYKLALRDGALYAVDVKWTVAGADRLRSKAARYISPAFTADDEGRPVELVNCALTSMPATFGARALIAASRAPLGRANSAMVGARLPLAVRARVELEAAKIGIRPGVYVRALCVLATRSDAAREKTLKDLRVALKLEKDAPVEEIRTALDALLREVDEAEPPPADPTAAGSDPGPDLRSLDPRDSARRIRYGHEFLGRRDSSGGDEDLPPRIRAASDDVKKRYRELRAKREADSARQRRGR